MVNKFLMLIFLFFNQVLGLSVEPEDTDGTWSLVGAKGYAGTVVVNAQTGSNLFYWLFEAIGGDIETDSLPLILWLQGGPGCSGETGMLWENISPIRINNKTEPEFNNNTWAIHYHIMSIDFPYGAGYSRAKSSSDNDYTTVGATSYLYNFLVALAKKYPAWFKESRDFYIFGESFGGHWIPGLAYKIIMENQASKTTGKVFIPLKGIGMGDPWVDPPTQSQYYAEYSFNTGLINKEQYEVTRNLETNVITNINDQNYKTALKDWESSYGNIVDWAGGINVYNMRDYEVNYDMSHMTKWLQLPSTKKLLHVDDSVNWVSCDDDVYNKMTDDIMSTTIIFLPYILNNIRVIVYNAQDDLIVNTPGTEAMLAAIDWSGTNSFLNSKRSVWKVNGQVAGYGMKSGNLNFVLILKAGHMCPHDQPINSRDMVYRFVNNMGWT